MKMSKRRGNTPVCQFSILFSDPVQGQIETQGVGFFPDLTPLRKKTEKNYLTEIPLANASHQMEKECKANPCCLESLFNSSPAAKITQTAHLAHPQLILLQDSAVTQDEHKLFGHHCGKTAGVHLNEEERFNWPLSLSFIISCCCISYFTVMWH